MKFDLDKVKKIFSQFNTSQRIAALVLAVAIPTCLALGVSAISQYTGVNAVPGSSSVSSVPSSSMYVPSSSLPASSSQAEPVKISLKPSSVEEDLEVFIVGENGETILNETFILVVKCAANGYNEEWEVSGDGFLKLTKLPGGDYTVSIQPKDGFIMPEEAVKITVVKKVEYEKVDVSDKVVDESKVDVSKEDAAYDDAPAVVATPAPIKDTVEYVNSSSKKVKKEVEKTTYKYKVVKYRSDGSIADTDGNSSGLYPKLDAEGYIISLHKLKTSSVASEALVSSVSSVSADAITASLLTLRVNALSPFMLTTAEVEHNETEGTNPIETPDNTEPTDTPTQEPTGTPTDPPATSDSTETSTPTDTPTTEPTAEPTKTPAETPTDPSATPDSTETPTPTNTPTTEPTAEPTETPAETPTAPPATTDPAETPSAPPVETTPPATTTPPTVSPSPTVTPTPTPTPAPELSETREDVFEADGKLKSGYKLSLEEKRTVTKVEEEVTVYYGWQTINKNRYYFDKNGEKVTGTQVIQGVTYYFDKDGVMGSRIGIDVSKYQGTIDWKAVKDSGIEFAIIRVGYRGYGSGALVEDPTFKRNIQGAVNAGLKVGVYIFSQAINTQEAVEEASMCLEAVKGYKLAYPIFFDTEYSTSRKTGRADWLSKSHRTTIAKAFCETIQNAGYQAGIYASASWFTGQLEYSQISQYDIWVAHYGVDKPNFSHHYDIWQYTGSGKCAGIGTAVDMNIGYTAY